MTTIAPPANFRFRLCCPTHKNRRPVFGEECRLCVAWDLVPEAAGLEIRWKYQGGEIWESRHLPGRAFAFEKPFDKTQNITFRLYVTNSDGEVVSPPAKLKHKAISALPGEGSRGATTILEAPHVAG